MDQTGSLCGALKYSPCVHLRTTIATDVVPSLEVLPLLVFLVTWVNCGRCCCSSSVNATERIMYWAKVTLDASYAISYQKMSRPCYLNFAFCATSTHFQHQCNQQVVACPHAQLNILLPCCVVMNDVYV